MQANQPTKLSRHYSEPAPFLQNLILRLKTTDVELLWFNLLKPISSLLLKTDLLSGFSRKLAAMVETDPPT